MELFYQRPPQEELIYAMNYYHPTQHLANRYRQRMSKKTKNLRVINAMLEASNEELGYRANYMLLFSIHGRPGETPNTEVRYYFNWEIVVDNVNKKIVTMYEDRSKYPLPAHLFGDPKERDLIYKLWFKNKEAVR